jgi:hypothetical protein
MLRKPILAALCLLLLGPAWSALAGLDPTLALYWPLDEGTGTIAYDMSGHGVNGTLVNGPAWVAPGKIGAGALRFNGSTTYVRGSYVPLNNRSFTVCMWINPALAGSMIIFSERQTSATDTDMHFRIGGPSNGGDVPLNGVRFGFYSDDVDSPTNVLTTNTWVHLTFWYDQPSKTQKIYVNGAQVATRTATSDFLGASGNVVIGSWNGSSQFYSGMIDDVQIYQKALAVAEIQNSMKGLADKSLAVEVSPADGATDVPQDATLSWKAGQYAASHDVYFGSAFADVNNASRADTTGILASKGQAETTFDPAGVFAYGQTYYWRIDEANKPADNTIFKGKTWSFTAEPYGYPITKITATASSTQSGMGGPEKTIDGSGLDKADLHGVELNTIWTSAGAKPNWIQYEFDKVYKLHQLVVWNSNQMIESFMGFGAKDVTIEYSTDGATWTTLAGVPEFAKAPGVAGYAANTTVAFGGIEAKFVKLTINTNWGGMAPQTGLSEVRFTYVPVQARAPQPAAAATGVSVDTDLNWRPGREAGSHAVSFGTDPNALGAAQTVTDHSFDAGSLTFGTTYYWKVDEVNTVTYPGEVWSFTTQEYAPVDDFESYTDDEGSRIYETWVDGWTNGTGSVVGYLQSPFAETTIIHGGKQSMPLEYNNVKTPFYSETERTFDTAQDWTGNGATHLGLWFYGIPVAFLEKPTGEILTSAMGADIYNTTDEFRFIYKPLTGDGSITVQVDHLDVTNAWAKAGVMIRENLNPMAKAVHTIVSGSNGFEFQYRPIANGNTTQFNTTSGTPALPQWLRLTRKGNTFTGEISSDGKTWTKIIVGTSTSVQDLLMNNTVYIGMAVTSHVANVRTTAQFSNVTTSGNVTGPWQVADVGVAHGGNSPGDLYVVVTDTASKAATLTYPGGANVNGWTHWQIPLSDLTSAGVKTTSVKKIAIGVGDPANPKAGGAGKTYIDDIGFGHPVK